MIRKLEMVFTTSAGKTETISLVDPKTGLTKAETEAAMNQIIAKSAFLSKNGALNGIKETKIRTTDEIALA